MLVHRSRETCCVKRVLFAIFVCRSMFHGLCPTFLEPQFINASRIRLGIILLKQISSGDFESKSQLILIASIGDSCVFRSWFGK
jgi:hypothetical protein